ncbi:hypothetical protein DFH28DRAFT_403269 [Melampsora americana]|nr:hypothetical protein DFH28DRAFT_403269 [Melampsora americana]
MVKLELFPSFLGMIQILHPLNSVQGKPNPMVLNGFQFLKESINGWGPDELEKAFKKDSQSISSLETCHSYEVGSILLAYLLHLTPGKNTRLASGLFFGLWKVWQKGGVSDTVKQLELKTQSNFVETIKKAYANANFLN